MDAVTIERLGLEGDGLAGPVRIPFSLPGERWAGDRMLAASPDRVTPGCRHFGACGGCALQHASLGFVAEWKREIIARALAARGLATEIRATLTSPPRSRRRAVFTGRRTRKGALLGFHGRRSDALVELRDCLVVRPEILAALPALAELVALGASRAAEVRITVTSGPAGLDVGLVGGKALDAGLRAALARTADAADLARLAWGDEVVVERRPPFQLLGGVRVVPPPGAFLQATAEGEAALVAAVSAAVEGARRMADLFAGCGTFTLPLAASAEVHAAEGSAAAVAALASGWRAAPGLRQVSVESRDLFRRPLRAAELARFDAVVIDPPRAGAAAQAAELARSGVGLVAVVSCNPISFARDAPALVAGGFRLDWVQPVDQFLWTGHVELAARFSR